MARVLARAAGVVAFDFRGHGGSGGLSTVGDLEVLDLAAAAGWARLLGYRRIVPVGFSLGAGVAVRYAALVAGTPDAVDAVVAVSAPSRWHYRGTRPMRLLHRGIETPIGRRVLAAGYGTRVAPRGLGPVARAAGRPRGPAGARAPAGGARGRRPLLPPRPRALARRGGSGAGRALGGERLRSRRGGRHAGAGRARGGMGPAPGGPAPGWRPRARPALIPR